MITSLLACFLATGTLIASTNVADKTDIKNVTYAAKTEDFTSLSWHNDNKSFDENTKLLFDKYSIDYNEALSSQDVYIQDEYVYVDDLSKDIIESKIQSYKDYENDETHKDRYVRFITKAYAIGFYDGNVVYHIKVTTEQKKRFKINKVDNLIIRHGANAVSFTNKGYKASGVKWIPNTIITASNQPPIVNVTYERLEPKYSLYGVCYDFDPDSKSMRDLISVTADYYMVATDYTEVQPIYVHNFDLFIDSVSISFGPVGVSMPTGKHASIMEGTPLSLKGYSDKVLKNIKLNPSDYGFESQYYFYKKEKNIEIDGVHISTSRLRCGYIVEKYINLSPDRINAGEAYLELHFDSYVYSMSTELSFWGITENLASNLNDKAAIQYLDNNGKWIDCYDILNNNISSDRNNLTKVSLDIISGTKGIRFYAKKDKPTHTWNKGRICIGKTVFKTIDIEF